MRWRCECRYDGTDFNGWQSQPNGNTIQDFIEKRLAIIFWEKIRIHGSGRTDTGVHARGQVFHFDGDWPHGPEKLLRAFRSGLPSGIQITEVQETDRTFHARYSVKKSATSTNSIWAMLRHLSGATSGPSVKKISI
jgi:tRNA pseudouridine38-40 synthase